PITLPSIQKQHLIARSQLLHSHQPLAVRAESKPSRITGQIVALAGFEKKRMPMIGVEGPELIKETAVSPAFGILLDPHLPIGGCGHGVVCVQFETCPGTISISRCYRGDAKQQQPCSLYSGVKH